jgi:probable rRNA maturation factor
MQRRERPTPTLSLSIQYASKRPVPARDRVRRWVRAAIAQLDEPARDYALTVRFVDVAEGRTLNRSFRDKDYATNVLTFPYPGENDVADDVAGSVAADVVVCMPVVEKEARAQHKDVMDHCAHLVIHGTLHAAGHDHETTARADVMEALERVALARFRIADPYLLPRGIDH